MRSLIAMAEHHNCRVGQHEFCGNYALGMDEAGRFVFFHKQVKEQVEEKAIDLLDIKACKPTNIGRKVAGDRVVERLGLELVPMDTIVFNLAVSCNRWSGGPSWSTKA